MKYSMQPEGRNRFRIKAERDIPMHNVKKGDLGGLVSGPNNLSQYLSCWVAGNALIEEQGYVNDNALVMGAAIVRGKASVAGMAVATDYAALGDNARITDEVKMSGNSEMFHSARGTGDAVIRGTARLGGSTAVSSNALVEYGTWLGKYDIRRSAVIRNQDDCMLFDNIGSESGYLTVYRGLNDDNESALYATRGCFAGTVEEFKVRLAQSHLEESPYYQEYMMCIAIATSRMDKDRRDHGLYGTGKIQDCRKSITEWINMMPEWLHTANMRTKRTSNTEPVVKP